MANREHIPDLPIERVRVGKVHAWWCGRTGQYIPTPGEEDGRDQPWKHSLLIEVEWSHMEDVGIGWYILSPVDHTSVDLQHTVNRTGHIPTRFLFCIDQERLVEACSGMVGKFVISGRSGDRMVCCSAPFELQLCVPFDSRSCAICFEEFQVPEQQDQAPEISQVPPLSEIDKVHAWQVRFHENQVARRNLRQKAREERPRILDHCDVLLCGHVFCRSCLDTMRQAGIPRGQFDVSCPICRSTVSS